MNDFTLLLPDTVPLILQNIEVDREAHQIHCTIATAQTGCACPDCQQVSHRVHSGYQRQIADLAWSDYPIQLRLNSRKFFCDNPQCPRKIFTERLPNMVAPWARCTLRLNHELSQIGLTAGGQAGAKLSQNCHCQRSRNTMLRRIMALPLPIVPTPKIVGIDDFAFHKGTDYGTIVVDLEHHRPMALLPDREAATVEDGLRDHPGIRILSRDRSATYKQAMDNAAPDAIQVADRFHLLRNLEAVIESCFSAQTAAFKHVETAYYGQVVVPPPPRSHQQSQRQASRQKRFENYQQVHELRQAGWLIEDIAHTLSMGKRTVYTYLSHPTFPERQPHARQGHHIVVSSYIDYLTQRWSEGIRQGQQLFQEIQQQGYQGSYASVMRFLQPLQAVKSGDASTLSLTQIRKLLKQKPLTARRAAWLVMKRPESRTEIEQELWLLLQQEPALTRILQLSQSFLELVRERQVEQLEPWLKAATDSGIEQFQRFATGLRADYAAVKAALQLAVSNGPVEGLNNRLKMLKRQMYGRASLDLLTRPFLLFA